METPIYQKILLRIYTSTVKISPFTGHWTFRMGTTPLLTSADFNKDWNQHLGGLGMNLSVFLKKEGSIKGGGPLKRDGLRSKKSHWNGWCLGIPRLKRKSPNPPMRPSLEYVVAISLPIPEWEIPCAWTTPLEFQSGRPSSMYRLQLVQNIHYLRTFPIFPVNFNKRNWC